MSVLGLPPATSGSLQVLGVPLVIGVPAVTGVPHRLWGAWGFLPFPWGSLQVLRVPPVLGGPLIMGVPGFLPALLGSLQVLRVPPVLGVSPSYGGLKVSSCPLWVSAGTQHPPTVIGVPPIMEVSGFSPAPWVSPEQLRVPLDVGGPPWLSLPDPWGHP